MPFQFLNDNSLKEFVLSLKLPKKVEESLISKIPQMDGPERARLLRVLTRIYLLDKEEKEEIKKIKDFWKGKTPEKS